MTRILLAGETWSSMATHIKGWDQFASVTHHRGADDFIARVAGDGLEFDYMSCEAAAETFPDTAETLARYDVVILSDIGANTLLLPSAVWTHSRRAPDRLKALRSYVAGGGALIMVGGYLSFQGISGAARYHRTPIEEVLPVTMLPVDDRIELPEGAHPEQVPGAGGHEVLVGLPGGMPFLLGVNEVAAKPDAQTLLRLPDADGGHPVLVTGRHGEGRCAAWTSDIGPHWMPPEFLDWAGLPVLWRNLLRWAAG